MRIPVFSSLDLQSLVWYESVLNVEYFDGVDHIVYTRTVDDADDNL
jgi:hypothetical protein